MNQTFNKYDSYGQKKHERENLVYPEGYIEPKALPSFTDPEFLGDKALNIAIYLTQAVQNVNKNRFISKNKITTNQIRRYYNEFKSIERNLGDNPDIAKWNNVYHKIKLIYAKSIYDANRSMNKLPKEFEEIIKMFVKSIPQDFDNGFNSFRKICLLFEAVVGYSSQFTRE